MITKVVIAAAGQGTRMLELSKCKSKHLIEVENRPFLAYLMDNLLLAGYTEIFLVVGFHPELMQDFKEKYLSEVVNIGLDKNKIKIEIVNQHEVLGPRGVEYGTACPVKCVKDKVDNESFVYLYGDNLFSVADLKSMNIADEFCYAAGLKNEHPEKYGVLIPDGDDFLDKIIEKPKEFVGDLINAGLYKFTPEVFEKLPLIEKSVRGEYEITDVVSLLAQEKKVKIKKIKDYWHDFGNPNDIPKLAEFIKNGCCNKTN